MFNNRTMNAVPYKPPNVDTEMAVPSSIKFCFINARLSYMEIASDTTAGPSKKISKSPGPNEPIPICLPPILYDCNSERKLIFDAATLASIAIVVHVNAVQVTNGCTDCLN